MPDKPRDSKAMKKLLATMRRMIKKFVSTHTAKENDALERKFNKRLRRRR